MSLGPLDLGSPSVGDEAEDLLRDDPDSYIDVDDILVECGELQNSNVEII